MVDSFGSLPPETVEGLSSSKSSRTRGRAVRKHTETSAKAQQKNAQGITRRKKTDKSDENQGVRWGLVDRVRAEIAAGTFETPDRIEATIDCILDDILDGQKNL